MATSDRPAAEGLSPGHYPPSPVQVDHTAPVPRRISARYDGVTVFDTIKAMYVWEHPYYPQFYIPADDVDTSLLIQEGRPKDTSRGRVQPHTLHHGTRRTPGAAMHLRESTVAGLDRTYRFTWAALDAWFEEDEQVFVHPRSPYVRVDALRSRRHVRVQKDGIVLAESAAPVAVFETGLPTRWYLDRSDIRWAHLTPSQTRSRCPYKGTTSDYWTVMTPAGRYEDLAWAYDFPTRQLQPITGLVAFYNEQVHITVHPQRIDTPATPASA